ncbi:unnamed protein product [Cyprideis torosa]|uniref:Uncharacterized protein n=1 Tax=Cyprideis torosa TaxID=163714 RepID=A0A7R8W918_9CRUS|nr:unnamed protein product [Cyprideis torosa]CAG0889259.1 unnamed protein product [Cyprideis torosa]
MEEEVRQIRLLRQEVQEKRCPSVKRTLDVFLANPEKYSAYAHIVKEAWKRFQQTRDDPVRILAFRGVPDRLFRLPDRIGSGAKPDPAGSDRISRIGAESFEKKRAKLLPIRAEKLLFLHHKPKFDF